MQALGHGVQTGLTAALMQQGQHLIAESALSPQAFLACLTLLHGHPHQVAVMAGKWLIAVAGWQAERHGRGIKDDTDALESVRIIVGMGWRRVIEMGFAFLDRLAAQNQMAGISGGHGGLGEKANHFILRVGE